MATELKEAAFPTLTADELALLRVLATPQDFADGETIFKAGDPDIDLFVVESGKIEILNPADGNQLIITHGPGSFAGDIDLITRRQVIVTAVASGPTRLLRVPGSKLRELLNRVPRFGEKLMIAFTVRRELLSQTGMLGLKVFGPGHCKATNLVREFLYKNFVPFRWFAPETPEGQRVFAALGPDVHGPIVECGDGHVLVNPSLKEIARGAGIWQVCPSQEVELAIVGAGPAGMAAAVYAASEGIATLVIDRLGPGGQVGGASKVENFLGFPAGLTGIELATRGVLQMLKFGAHLVAPLSVERLETGQGRGALHTLHLDCGSKVQAPIVLIASGIRWRKLAASDADRFEGAGIYYVCTSVEALLYDDCDVAVVGAGNSAGQAAMFLADCCRSRRVHLLVRHRLGPGMSEYLAARIRATENITVHEEVEITSACGQQRLEAVVLQGKDAPHSVRLACSAVFVFIGADPSAPWLPDTVARDNGGYILTGVDASRSGCWPLKDRDPCPLETTVPGVLAAGDLRSGSTKRVGFAVGDGSLAVTCAHSLRALRP
jgi:thioredoxin reductase (NADPH)